MIHMQNGLHNVCEFIDIMWRPHCGTKKTVSYYRRQLAKEPFVYKCAYASKSILKSQIEHISMPHFSLFTPYPAQTMHNVAHSYRILLFVYSPFPSPFLPLVLSFFRHFLSHTNEMEFSPASTPTTVSTKGRGKRKENQKETELFC